MNDNVKACKTCMHYDSGLFRSLLTTNDRLYVCRNPNYQGWDIVEGETIPRARDVRQDEYMCGISAAGHEKRLTLHERISSHWHGFIFGASVLLFGLGVVVALEGDAIGGAALMALFGYGAWWGYQGLPEA